MKFKEVNVKYLPSQQGESREYRSINLQKGTTKLQHSRFKLSAWPGNDPKCEAITIQSIVSMAKRSPYK